MGYTYNKVISIQHFNFKKWYSLWRWLSMRWQQERSPTTNVSIWSLLVLHFKHDLSKMIENVTRNYSPYSNNWTHLEYNKCWQDRKKLKRVNRRFLLFTFVSHKYCQRWNVSDMPILSYWPSKRRHSSKKWAKVVAKSSQKFCTSKMSYDSAHRIILMGR